jgi:hypothetical protein
VKALLIALLLAAPAVAVGPAGAPREGRAPLEAFHAAQQAEVVRGDLVGALALYREAAKAPAGPVRTDAQIGIARVLLRQDDLKSFGQALAALTAQKDLTPAQSAEVARLKRTRDDPTRERPRPTPSPAPGKAVRDVYLTDVSLEDAAASLAAQYGATIVTPDPATARVSLSLKGVTLAQALLALVFHVGLDARQVGHTLYVGPARRLAAFFPTGAPSASELFSAEAVPRAIAPPTSVSLHLRSQPVPEAVKRLVEGFGVNIVAAGTAQKVTVDLSRVGLDGALRSIASQLGWEIRRVNDMFFLGPGTQLAVYFPGFERRYLRLKHVAAGEIYDQVQQFLGQERLRLARAEVDIVGNALIIEGDKRDLDKVERFLLHEDVAQKSIEIELYLKDASQPKATESPRKRMRMLAGQPGIVALEAEMPGETPPVQLQLMVELTPRVRTGGQITFDLAWRLTTLRANAIADVQEGGSKGLTTGPDTPLEVPVVVGPGGQAKLALVLRPAD